MSVQRLCLQDQRWPGHHARNDVLEEEDLAEGWVPGCQALPAIDEVAVIYDG